MNFSEQFLAEAIQVIHRLDVMKIEEMASGLADIQIVLDVFSFWA